MPIFKTGGDGKLKKVKAISIAKEKELQVLVEGNLGEVLGMHFLATEYTTTFGGRIDTLAVDYNGAPVIIEYKRNKNDNVINQGLSYLKWLKAQKVEFFQMLLRNELGEEIGGKIQVDWKNPRVVCIAESYSKFDMDTVEVIPMKIELYKYRIYEDKMFSLEPIGASEQNPISPVLPDSIDPEPEKSLERLLSKGTDEIRDLYKKLRSKIIELDEDISEKATSLYIAYRMTKNFAEVHIGKSHIKLYLRPIAYEDPKAKIEKIPEGYNWTLDRRVYLRSEEDIDYVLQLIEQSYKDVL